MDALGVILTTIGGALSATLGVVVGGVVTRRVQERHWLRDRQLTAYEELFNQYARFMIELGRAHYTRTPSQVDWAAWSAALTAVSLVAPADVARAVDRFGRAIDVFLAAVASRDPVTEPVSEDDLGAAAEPAGQAHKDLLNAIRRSLGRQLGEVSFYLGGTPSTPAAREAWRTGVAD
jgi:hypothetical protein